MSSPTIAEVCAQVDALAAEAAEESKAVSQTFVEMRSFVAESVGRLRTDMIRRFEGVDKRLDIMDKRFDRLEGRLDGLEGKLDRVLDALLRLAPKARRH